MWLSVLTAGIRLLVRLSLLISVISARVSPSLRVVTLFWNRVWTFGVSLNRCVQKVCVKFDGLVVVGVSAVWTCGRLAGISRLKSSLVESVGIFTVDLRFGDV